MKIRKKSLLALFLTVSIASMMASAVYADGEGLGEAKGWNKKPPKEGNWYKFETSQITLLFPSGKKPMFIWWYTNDTSTVYVVKFQGLIEYLIFDNPYYLRKYRADSFTVNETIWKPRVEPKLPHPHGKGETEAGAKFMKLLSDLHPAFMPFSACQWTLEGPEPTTYGWAFNFTLTKVPMHKFGFAENNIQIRCRFYNISTTEVPDENSPDYNYTVAAGQLKFDFVVGNWEWNMDKLRSFFDWLRETYGVNVSTNESGLALWINMASIKMEDIDYAKNEVESQFENQVEAKAQTKGVMIGDEYYPVEKNETAANQDEKPIQLREHFREHVRIRFACEGKTIAGFLEFVPWARLLDESGDTIDYVNVTASYIAAGGHLRLFICYPYFGDYTLEHDPTIGLTAAPHIPTLVTPELVGTLLAATVATTLALAIYKKRKGTVNIVSP